MLGYQEFLETKAHVAPSVGVTVPTADLHPALFPFQRDLVQWALRKGRSALFTDTGTGKTLMQVVWATNIRRHTSKRVLIVAPLAVAQQTVREAGRWGMTVTYCRKPADLPADGLAITNYEMVESFPPELFGAVVLDESSILKNFEGKTRSALIRQFSGVPYRLCCTATPAPNDIGELANHAEFLGVMKRVEMLATFFVHDEDGWRLKGHAGEAFGRWLASWSMTLSKPSDLGYSDEGFVLPELEILPNLIETDWAPPGQLLPTKVKGITERAMLRATTIEARVQVAADLINEDPREPWIAWVGLNDEGRSLADLVPDAVLVEGADSPEVKAAALGRFAQGDVRVMITKPTIAGFGMNFQHCARMAFVGLGDSYEQYYQAIRRCWRFGQTRAVRAHVVLTEPEEPIYQNVLRKEREANAMKKRLVEQVATFEQAEVRGQTRSTEYRTGEQVSDGWRLLMGDSAERLAELEPETIDLSVFSPPFGQLYTYSDTDRDLGNCGSDDVFWEHMNFISKELLRVTKPGRNVCVHVAQIPLQKARDGVIGLTDFRGGMIRHFVDAGFIYHGEVCIDKDPQAQAIRTKSKALLFTQLRKDAVWLRPALADYILIFRAPGENAIQIKPEITNDQWIEWARPIWYGIRESDTLNAAEGRANDDDKHICPLQLGTIERCIALWSNRGETVLDPFAGIGSTGYQAVMQGRRFVGCELKTEYFRAATLNLRRAEQLAHAPDLFSMLEAEEVSA